MRGWLLVIFLVGPLPALATTVDERASAFAGVVPDPEPPEVTNGVHYLVSNEQWTDLFAEAVEDVRGVQIGVGAEQNYLLAGWARPELLVLFDFDQVVIDLHEVYRHLLLASPDPASFVARWQRRAEEKTATLLRSVVPDKRRGAGIARTFKRARRVVDERFAKLVARSRETGLATFLSDPASYAFVQGLYREGRVFAVRGDLTQEGAFLAAASALERLKLPVRVVYLSNAEHYFPYGAAYKKNLLALPLDERSVVLRTQWVGPQNYRFVVQAGLDFQAWLAQGWVNDVRRLFERLEPVRGKLMKCGPPPESRDAPG